MIYPFKKVVFDCRQATFLSVKRDEGAITPHERIKLWYHLLYCEPCRRFISHWRFLKGAGNSAILFSRRPPFKLPDEARAKIQGQLDQSAS